MILPSGYVMRCAPNGLERGDRQTFAEHVHVRHAGNGLAVRRASGRERGMKAYLAAINQE